MPTGIPPLPPAPEDMTIEIRDSSGIPWVQARVTARDAGEALAKASSAHPDTQWLFLREMTTDEIAQLIRDQASPAHPGTATTGGTEAAQAQSTPGRH